MKNCPVKAGSNRKASATGDPDSHSLGTETCPAFSFPPLLSEQPSKNRSTIVIDCLKMANLGKTDLPGPQEYIAKSELGRLAPSPSFKTLRSGFALEYCEAGLARFATDVGRKNDAGRIGNGA